jgi:hypothetical protein
LSLDKTETSCFCKTGHDLVAEEGLNQQNQSVANSPQKKSGAIQLLKTCLELANGGARLIRIFSTRKANTADLEQNYRSCDSS